MEEVFVPEPDIVEPEVLEWWQDATEEVVLSDWMRSGDEFELP